MKDKRAFIFRILAAALIILAAATGERSTTAMLCFAGMCGLTANKLDGGAGCLCNFKRDGEAHGDGK